jgi:hypothetical protein
MLGNFTANRLIRSASQGTWFWGHFEVFGSAAGPSLSERGVTYANATK